MTAHDPMTNPVKALLTVGDFMLLADAGAFSGYARSELIEGEIWVVNAVHRRHAQVQAALTGQLWSLLKAGHSDLTVYSTPSIALSDVSQPEPDIAIAPPSTERILQGSGVLIAIEIADSTLTSDLERKTVLYARHGIPEYWIVDLPNRTVHQRWQPTDGIYAKQVDLPFGMAVTAATIPDLTIDTTDL